ncbi:MAG TPA: hypothetical protein VHH35_20305 [Pyrinomonadaceae bacterium]|nr:hypothetical protein [Pyrinomonadaceae bacterium]
MKEITRRLYTKPVMLGMAFLVGMALVVALFVTTKSSAAPNGFPVAAGFDEFETAADGETFHDFAGSPIPANFFGSGSLAFSGLVPLKGVPIDPGVSDVDTVIRRHQSVSAPGGSTPLTMTALSLEGISSITVTYSNNTTEQWNVRVGLSDYQASTGSMTIHSSTFDSTLKVWPKFTFTRVGGGVPPKVLDTGNPNGPALTAASHTGVIEDSFEPGPAPAPTVAPAPCRTVIGEFEPISKTTANNATLSAAAATSSCAPVTLSSTNSPWVPCSTGLCIIVPITEEERWARHRPGPRGTIKGSSSIGVAAE